jgi:uncharacterized protein (TIGR04255 family)
VEAPIEIIADFERPPVVEVVLGVQFSQAVVDLEVLAEFAVAIKDEFPNREQKEPLAGASESFARPPDPPRIEFRFGAPPMPRTWFESPDRRLLVQLQADRLIFNWRRVEREDTYPHYNVLRPKFDALHEQLEGILRRQKGEPGTVDNVEVSYINELASSDEPSGYTHPGLADMLTTVASVEPGGFLPEPEDAGYMARFRIPSPDGTGKPVGRLLVSTDPAYRTSDQRPIYLLKLSANLVGTSSTREAVVDMLDLGRRWVVEGFLQLTTPAIQSTWGPLT